MSNGSTGTCTVYIQTVYWLPAPVCMRLCIVPVLDTKFMKIVVLYYWIYWDNWLGWIRRMNTRTLFPRWPSYLILSRYFSLLLSLPVLYFVAFSLLPSFYHSICVNFEPNFQFGIFRLQIYQILTVPWPVFRIRIGFMRIRIQHFCWMRIRIRVQIRIQIRILLVEFKVF
jgi:hypothetical protein